MDTCLTAPFGSHGSCCHPGNSNCWTSFWSSLHGPIPLCCATLWGLCRLWAGCRVRTGDAVAQFSDALQRTVSVPHIRVGLPKHWHPVGRRSPVPACLRCVLALVASCAYTAGAETCCKLYPSCTLCVNPASCCPGGGQGGGVVTVNTDSFALWPGFSCAFARWTRWCYWCIAVSFKFLAFKALHCTLYSAEHFSFSQFQAWMWSY